MGRAISVRPEAWFGIMSLRMQRTRTRAGPVRFLRGMVCVMRLLVITGTLVVASLTLPQALADNVRHGLRVPAGFEVTEYAGSDLANDIYCMTLDPRGRVVVSGRGYLRVLLDDKNTGKA